MRSLRLLACLLVAALLAAACASDSASAGADSSATTTADSSASDGAGSADGAAGATDDDGDAPSTDSASDADSTDDASPSTTAAAGDDDAEPADEPASTTTEAPAPPRVPSAVDLARTPVGLELVASASSPVAVAVRPGSDDLYIAEQSGRVLRIPGGSGEITDDVGIDLRGGVSTGNEQGLLGLAFSPDAERLFTYHTASDGSSVVTRWDVDGAGVDSGSAEAILTVPQPAGNHNGGHLLFGPDGHLWVGLGDGGGGGDPWEHGQNPDTLLGAMLRIDVSGDGYSIPADNPFVDVGGAPEVAVWGVRNPWRFGFDPATDDLWIADVGQDRFEEITVLRRGGDVLGANLGWNLREGDDPFRGGDTPAGHAEPFVDYAHTGGRCSITGGEVYRGSTIGALDGAYIFSDFCTGELLALSAGGDAEIFALDAPAVDRPTSFGFDSDGELLVLSRSGGIFRLVPA